MEVFGEKILDPKIGVKILDGKWVKWKPVRETVLGWEIKVNNSKMENWCKNPESVKQILVD